MNKMLVYSLIYYLEFLLPVLIGCHIFELKWAYIIVLTLTVGFFAGFFTFRRIVNNGIRSGRLYINQKRGVYGNLYIDERGRKEKKHK